MLDRLVRAAGHAIEKAIEDAILDEIRHGGEKKSRHKAGCIKAWLRDFKQRPGGVHLVIGRQRSGKTALCYFLAQTANAGKKTRIYAITAAREVPPGVYVIHDVDIVPTGGVCIIDDASLFFNSMRTKNNEENYMLLRDLLLISEKQDICFIFNTHDSSLLHSTVLGQCRNLIFKEPNLMFGGTERPAIRKIMEHVQQGFSRIPKTRRASYFFLYSADCKGWGRAPLPTGWNNKVSTSVNILQDAEFTEIPEEPVKKEKLTDAAEESFEDFKKTEGDDEKKKGDRKGDGSPG